jgi:hypothetical protein
MGCGQCRLGDGLRPSPRLGQPFGLPTLPTALTTRWVPFRLSSGYFFNCQGSGKTAQVGLFSIVKWVLFRLTKTITITTFGIFSDTLYVTTHSSSGLEIWRSDTGNSGDWSRVVANGNGNADNQLSTSLMEFDSYLYAAVENETDGAEIWRTSNGITWTAVITGGFGSVDNTQTGGFAIFDGYLWFGTRNEATGAEIWRSNNGTNWTPVVQDGFGDSNNFKIESLFAFDSYLYAGTDNNVTGIEVWRSSDGATWTQINVDGFGDSNNEATLWSVGTVAFDNDLYIGVSNNADGGKVWMKLGHQLFLPLVLSK